MTASFQLVLQLTYAADQVFCLAYVSLYLNSNDPERLSILESRLTFRNSGLFLAKVCRISALGSLKQHGADTHVRQLIRDAFKLSLKPGDILLELRDVGLPQCDCLILGWLNVVGPGSQVLPDRQFLLQLRQFLETSFSQTFSLRSKL